MAEPSSSTATGVIAIAIAVFGGSVAAGEFSTVVFGALAGSMWALKASETATNKISGAVLILKLVMTALVLTWMVAWWLRESYALPHSETLGVIAFGVAAVGDRWQALGGVLFNGLRELIKHLVRGTGSTKSKDEEK